MDKSVWVKIVWLGAVLAIPAAIVAVQKPEAPRIAESRRVMALDQPVAVDIRDNQIEAVKPVESAPPVEAAKPKAMHLGAEKITSALAPVAGPQAQ